MELEDEFVLPGIIRYHEIKEYRIKEADNIRDEAIHKKHTEDLSKFAEGLLEAPAEKRQDMIDDMNSSLYQEEVKRMALLEGELNDENKEYLANLRKEISMLGQRTQLSKLWREWDSYKRPWQPEELDDLVEFERRLGVL